MLKFCFDCDDTLYDLQEPFIKSIEKTGIILPVGVNTFFKIYRQMGDRVFDLEHAHIITSDDVGIYRIYEACKELHIPLSLEKAADFQDFYRYYQKHITMHPLLHDYFSQTESTIAILTNGQEGHQKDKVRTLGMYQYLDDSCVFSSQGIGFAKPDSRAFEMVAKQMHSDVKDWFYIGDNYVNDMEGAKKAGMRTIHFNRHHLMEGPMSDYIVYSEKELIDLLKELEQK